MKEFWDKLNYDEVKEYLTSAPILASEWRRYGGGFAGDYEWIRIDILTRKDLVMVFEGQDRTKSLQDQPTGQYIWQLSFDFKFDNLSGVANTLEEAKQAADDELIKRNVRLA